MTPPLQATEVTTLHDHLLATPGWPQHEPAAGPAVNAELWRWVQTNHRNNCLLWAEEDLARRTTVAAEAIAANKRAIDRFNQARNDATERVDELLLMALGLVDEASARSAAPVARAAPGARLNSETAGSMIDRLSIMALRSRPCTSRPCAPTWTTPTAKPAAPSWPGWPSSAPTWPAAWTRCWRKRLPERLTSRFTGSSRCTTIRR
jgi:hypothetical protein